MESRLENFFEKIQKRLKIFKAYTYPVWYIKELCDGNFTLFKEECKKKGLTAALSRKKEKVIFRRLFKADVENFLRAGNLICQYCEEEYLDHPRDEVYYCLINLCDGTTIKP